MSLFYKLQSTKDFKLPSCVTFPVVNGKTQLPTECRPSTSYEWLEKRKHWSPDFIQYETVEIEGKSRTTHIYWYGPDGYMIVYPKDSKLSDETKKYYHTDKPLFFKIGCDHDYKSTKLGNCWHRYTCSKCGHSYEIDSSD